MEKQNFWNDAAKCGAIIGAILAVSMVLETMMTLSGSMKYYALMTVEWIGVVVLHYYLLHRFTRNRSKLYSAEEGFSFGQGYLFVLAVSAFAGVIVGGVQYIYLHLIMGYSNYTSRLVEALTDMMALGGGPLGACDRLGRYLGKPALRRCFRPYHCRCAFARSAAVRYAGR